MTERNILTGWAKTGLFPFDPSRVFRDIIKLDAPLTVRLPYEVEIAQNKVIKTPVTLLSSEAVTHLLGLIKQEPYDSKPNETRRAAG